jgi:uncharacterized membrane protein YjgN (DUF898 family)
MHMHEPDLSANPSPEFSHTPRQARYMDIAFTGSGSEYFRIWIVNLLLMLVTLGIYYPWAKVRRMRYFHSNTLVEQAPLGFHGSPIKMLKGYALVGVLAVLYQAVGNISATAQLCAFLIVMALAPALLKSSMQFRLANTSWRGLRLGFKGSLQGAYAAVLPLLLPSLVVIAGLTAVPDPEKPPMWYLYTMGALTLCTLAVLPWLLWNLKRYQHQNYALASLQTAFKATRGSFYMLFFKAFGLALLAMVVTLSPFFMFIFSQKASGAASSAGGAGMAALGVLPLLGLLFVFVAIKPYMVSRMQNLVWGQTGNTTLRFVSTLRFKSLLWLTLKNWILIVLTLGLYLPWPWRVCACRPCVSRPTCRPTPWSPSYNPQKGMPPVTQRATCLVWTLGFKRTCTPPPHLPRVAHCRPATLMAKVPANTWSRSRCRRKLCTSRVTA